MIVIHIVNGRQPQNNSSLWPPGHKQLHTNVIIEISAGKAGKNRENRGKTPKEEKRVGAKSAHHPYAVCTQRKMTKKDEKSICKPTPPTTLTIFLPSAIGICLPFVPKF